MDTPPHHHLWPIIYGGRVTLHSLLAMSLRLELPQIISVTREMVGGGRLFDGDDTDCGLGAGAAGGGGERVDGDDTDCCGVGAGAASEGGERGSESPTTAREGGWLLVQDALCEIVDYLVSTIILQYDQFIHSLLGVS